MYICGKTKRGTEEIKGQAKKRVGAHSRLEERGGRAAEETGGGEEEGVRTDENLNG